MGASSKSPRPTLTVEFAGGKQLGNCYSATYYRVTSRFKLDAKKLRALRDAGFLGLGQDFNVKSQCDGTELPAGYDVAPMLDEETGEPAINRLTGQPYAACKFEFYTYDIEDRCDSGD